MGANPLFSHPAIIRVDEQFVPNAVQVTFWVDRERDLKKTMTITHEMLRGVRDPNTIIEHEIYRLRGKMSGARKKIPRADWKTVVEPTTAESWADKWMTEH